MLGLHDRFQKSKWSTNSGPCLIFSFPGYPFILPVVSAEKTFGPSLHFPPVPGYCLV